jgi:hypothetical protein
MPGVGAMSRPKAEASMEKRKYEVAYHILAALLLLMISSSAVAQEYVPIEDLQWLYIDGTVGLIAPKNGADAARARAIMDRAYEARTAGDLDISPRTESLIPYPPGRSKRQSLFDFEENDDHEGDGRDRGH